MRAAAPGARAGRARRRARARRQDDRRSPSVPGASFRARPRRLDRAQLRRSRLGRAGRGTFHAAPTRLFAAAGLSGAPAPTGAAGDALRSRPPARRCSCARASPSPTPRASGSSSCAWPTTTPSSPTSTARRSPAGGWRRTGAPPSGPHGPEIERLYHSGAVGRAPVAAARRQLAGGGGLRLARPSGRRSRRRRQPWSTSARPAASGSCAAPICRRRPTARKGLGLRVNWQTDLPASGTVVPRAGRLRQNARGAAPIKVGPAAATRQAVTLDGLAPGASYSYRVEADAGGGDLARAPVRRRSRRWLGRRSRCASPSTATCATPGTPRIGRLSRRWCARRRR